MTRYLLVLALVAPLAALAQDTGDTATPEKERTVYALPEGGALTEGGIGGKTYLLSKPALAFTLESPRLEDGITRTPPGSYLLLKGNDGSFTVRLVAGKQWLLPDAYYSDAIVKAKQLKICQPALDKMTETALGWQQRTYDESTRCLDQFDGDEALIQDATSKLQTMESRALLAEDRLKVARRNQAVAWAIAGGLVLGASTVIVVSVSP
jgi:hypothetical protein